MMSCMLIMIVCICYLCHWRFQDVEGRYGTNHSWFQAAEPDTPIHIFTLEQHCCNGTELLEDREERFSILPPPDYESAMASCEKWDNESTDPDLPSYESALKLSSFGYV